MSRLDDFLANAKPPKGGGRCTTCQHAKREKIEADGREFNERRRGGVAVTWDYFTREYLKPTYGYEHDYRALVKHLEKCRGIEIV